MSTETQKRQFTGEVVSVNENKTIHVLVQTTKLHPKYQKQYTTGKKYAVHDEKNEAALGNTVVFEECRPLSKTKRWRLVSIQA
jgi:small subunit ribosomal protein S17